MLSVSLLACILLSILIFMLETMPELNDLVAASTWHLLEVICTVIFTLEYGIRLCVCSVTGKKMSKFVKTPMNVVDLSAILPFYATLAMEDISFVRTLGILRTIRLVRLFRILKLGRYSTGLQLMMTALKNSSQAALVLSFFLGIGIVLFSSLIYYVEKMGCPDREMLHHSTALDGSSRTQLEHYLEQCRWQRQSEYALCCDEHDAPLDFPNIIEAFWWSIVTMTTVGFGDIYPQTRLGRIVGTITMLSGILLIALPIAIIGRKFQEAYDAHMALKGVTKEQMEKQKGPPRNSALHDMGRRLRLMPLHGELGALARDMAGELEVLNEMQQEIASMEEFEREKQREVIGSFDTVVNTFLKSTQCRSSKLKKAGLVMKMATSPKSGS